MFTNLILKKCTICKTLKPLGGFHRQKDKKYGVMELCSICRNIKIVNKKYNLNPGERDKLFESQGKVCAICKKFNPVKNKWGTSKNLAVDHCHKTGKVRGLLCSSCNHGLGRFKDSIDSLENAIIYLKKELANNLNS